VLVLSLIYTHSQKKSTVNQTVQFSIRINLCNLDLYDKIVITYKGAVMYLRDWFTKKKIPQVIETYKYKIMHITDTPAMTFTYLESLIRLISPDVIIHTGDFVDNYKLEISRKDIKAYEREFHKLSRILRSAHTKKIIYCLGNHDDETIVRRYLKQDEVLCHKTSITIGNTKLSMAHYYEACSRDADILMFGHSYDYDTLKQDQIMLNGLDGIFIIEPSTKKITMIPYPKGTDNHRLRSSRLTL